MKIAIFGLGYVGSVSAACLAAAGHHVTGVDVDPHKLALLGSGRAPVSEPGLDDLLGQMIEAGRVTVTGDAAAAVAASDLSLVCVATPSRRNGSLDTTYLERVMAEIGAALRGDARYHVVAVRSTVLPGVVQGRLVPILEEASGRTVPDGIGVCVNPEFLREGSAIRDFEKPPFTIIGETDTRAGDVMLQAYAHLQAPVHRVRPDEASMVKYASNNYHALKVAFANEIGRISIAKGIDPQRVADMFLADTKLNVSPAYLRPGGPFGGSCLPKDLGAMLAMAREAGVQVPVLGGTRESNEVHGAWLVQAIQARGPPPGPVLLIGLSFKAGTDDLRNSPLLTLAEALLDAGYDLRVFDPDLDPDRLVGVNFALAAEHQEVLRQRLTRDLSAAADGAQLVVIGKSLPDHAACLPADLPRLTITRLGTRDG